MSTLRISLAFFASLHAFAADPAAIRRQANLSVALLQKVAAQWKTPCTSCHHQVLPAMALESARLHGLTVDEAGAQKAAARSFRMYASLDDAIQLNNIIDPALSEGYALLGAHASGVAPNLSTAVYARHLSRNQRADGSWPTFDSRPPHSAGTVPATAIAARAVSLYLPQRHEARRTATLERARRWLLAAKSTSTEDATYRVLGLYWTRATSAEQSLAARELFALQRADGGWGQMPEMQESDAYSTGQALYALVRTGALPRDHAVFQRGAAWLLRTQAKDGSWLVKSRIRTPAPVSPPYFESGFPYGHDQYLSCAATAWAVMALAEGLEPAASPARPHPVPEAVPAVQPWMETALFGTAEEVAKLAPGLATANGTTALMMAADDPAKVRVLLAKGAKSAATAKSGHDALMAAVLFRDNRETAELLIAAGASPKARDGVRYKASALPVATVTGDPAMTALLLERGSEAGRPITMLGMFSITPLGIAVNNDDAETVRLLVKAGASLTETDEFGMNQVSWAALAHKDAALKALLELGAKKDVKDKFGLTPLEHTRGIAGLSVSTEQVLRAAK